MWQALAAYAVRGPAQAALLSFSTLLLSLLLPPLAVISNAVIALVWLRLGPVKGATTVAIALVAGTLVAGFSGNPFTPAALMMSFWMPVIVMAYVLGRTVSLNLAILAGGGLALAGVLIVYIVLDQPSESWLSMVEKIVEATKGETGNDANTQLFVDGLADVGKWITGFSAATQLVLAVLSLLLARVWQARMFNPGGLQQEFHRLRFGLTAGVAGAIVLVASVVLQMELLTNLAIVVIALFAFQGIAVLHALVAQFKMHVIFLVAVYVCLVFLSPQSIIVIGLLGMADTWLDFRNRLSAPGGSN